MTTPSPSSPEQASAPQASAPPHSATGQSKVQRITRMLLHRRPEDPIPIAMLALIFLVVITIIIVLLAPNWMRDWNRHQSIVAQRDRDYPKAVEYLTKIINTPPEEGTGGTRILPSENPTFLSELGNAYYHLGKYDLALEWMQKAQKHGGNLPPDDQGGARPPADFSSQIGMIYYKLGNIPEAEKHLLAALAKDKLGAHTNFYLGEIEMQRGNYVKAADYFKVVSQNDLYKDQVKKYYAEIEQKLFAGIQ